MWYADAGCGCGDSHIPAADRGTDSQTNSNFGASAFVWSAKRYDHEVD
jgi:hypothetical protein